MQNEIASNTRPIKGGRYKPQDVVQFRMKFNLDREGLAVLLGMSIHGVKAWEENYRKVPEPICRMFDTFYKYPGLLAEF